MRPGRIGPVHQEQALRRVRATGLWFHNGEHGKSHQVVMCRVGLINLMHTPGHPFTCANSRSNPTENTIRVVIQLTGQNGGCGHGFLYFGNQWVFAPR